MQVNRDQFLEQGYLILRNVVPPNELEGLRKSYEILVQRQRAIWALSRMPDDPPGGVWESSPQPRLILNSGRENGSPLIDQKTASTVEFWLHENTQGISSQLMDVNDAAVTEMFLMCNPVRDRGPANWHRDIHPIDTAPLMGYIEDIKENGPSYVQWNIPLYDDEVLWVVPGSHIRLNTEEENCQLLDDPHAPLSTGIQTHLAGGDGVVYITPILHWGSNYSIKLRRTIHGGFASWGRTYYRNLDFARYLNPGARETLERWVCRSAGAQDCTEAALRAAIAKDGTVFRHCIEKIHPGVGENGKRLIAVFLCKAAIHIRCTNRPNLQNVPEDLRNRGTRSHSITLNWGPKFADRFTLDESDALWERFKNLDAALQKDEEQFSPGFQSGPMRYNFNEMPTDFHLDNFIAGW